MDKDNDISKGAVESDRPSRKSDVSLGGQLGHRTSDPLIKSSDTDFPEPGPNPEHSGEPTSEESPEGVIQDQEPGARQKKNQGDKKDDPLAA